MDKDTLTASLALVDLPDDGLTVLFYEKLFAAHPEVQPMFSRSTRGQAAMLRTAVISVVEHLDDPEWLTTTLGALGRRHADLGVGEALYPVVAQTLIATMAEIAGPAWTDEYTAQWAQALTAVADLMLAGYPEAETDSGAA
ncbi:globin domain-containing protein [Gordonia sp. DT30]|uniref:globin domain-containing protein n=1 Tax=unclassified Gordonia (in: high G+C Gram-positive bacteria) TaxID=2657482 RepID=UPI003CEE5555